MLWFFGIHKSFRFQQVESEYKSISAGRTPHLSILTILESQKRLKNLLLSFLRFVWIWFEIWDSEWIHTFQTAWKSLINVILIECDSCMFSSVSFWFYIRFESSNQTASMIINSNSACILDFSSTFFLLQENCIQIIRKCSRFIFGFSVNAAWREHIDFKCRFQVWLIKPAIKFAPCING